ncbi:MAG: alpha/beta hydrolase family protein [Janthinobacterium lividum]
MKILHMRSPSTAGAAFLTAMAWFGPSFAQSVATTEMFDAVAECPGGGNLISAMQCRRLEQQQTAVWVTVRARGYCLRYYASGLGERNPVVAAWLHGDIGGSRSGPSGHQKGLGVAAMIDQERQLSEKYRTPFIFIARPGAYGSAGYHHDLASTRLEAELVAAQLDRLTERYGIKTWVLGGHSGGGTLVAAMLAQRADIACAVISSGAPAYDAYLRAHSMSRYVSPANLNSIDDVRQMPKVAGQRIIVMGDPRDKNVFWSLQQLYFDALKRQGTDVTLLPLERGRPPEFHSLVGLAETATGLCAQKVPIAEIQKQLTAMPSQQPRESN